MGSNMKRLCENSSYDVYDDGNKWIVQSKTDKKDKKEHLKSDNPNYALALVAKWGFCLSEGVSEKDLIKKSSIKSNLRKALVSDCLNVLKAEEGQKKMIFGRPFHYAGGKWVLEETPKSEDGKKKQRMKVKEVDAILRKEGLEHITELEERHVKRLLRLNGIDFRKKSPEQLLKDLIGIYGDIKPKPKPKPKTEEPKTEEPKTEEPKTEEPKTEEPKTEEPKIGKQYFWRVAKTPEEAMAHFKKSVPHYSLYIGKNVSLETINKIGERMGDLVQKSPRIQKILSESVESKILRVIDSEDVSHFSSNRHSSKKGVCVLGLYSFENKTITVGSGRKNSNQNLYLGYGHNSNNVGGGSQLSCTVHEFGHFVYFSKDRQVMDKFHEVYSEKNSSLRNFGHRHPVSIYAASSERECFAECFAAFFHPDYGRDGMKNKKLPEKVEKVFKELFEGEVK